MDVREKLMELMDDYTDHLSVRDIHKADFAEKFADHLIANGVTVQGATDNNVGCKWISVKDRLPQDDLPFGGLCEIVQVLLDDGTVTVGWCNRGLKGWYYLPIQAANFVGNDYDKTPVIAWQPLAQPPKGE